MTSKRKSQWTGDGKPNISNCKGLRKKLGLRSVCCRARWIASLTSISMLSIVKPRDKTVVKIEREVISNIGNLVALTKAATLDG